MSTKKAIDAFENEPIDLADLSGQQLFRQANLVGMESLLRDCPTLTLKAGDTVIEPGQMNQLLYLVLYGTLHVYENEPTGEPLAVIQKGECVGLMSVIDQQPCHVRVAVKQTCRLLVIDEERFLALANSSPAVARNVLSMVMQYLRAKKVGAPERGRLQQRMEQNSTIDPVTGLYNQRWLDNVLERQILRAATDKKPLSVLAVGIAKFADFKRDFGTEVGDFALALIAQVIGAHVRPTDMLARHESDCLLVVLPETDALGATFVENRIKQAVAQTPLEIPGACSLPPLNLVTGKVEMKAFVAARKLVDDAVLTVTDRERVVAALSAVG